MLVETVLSMVTMVCGLKKVFHRSCRYRVSSHQAKPAAATEFPVSVVMDAWAATCRL
jgi:hypothetical protein